jgi:hypothetical protein
MVLVERLFRILCGRYVDMHALAAAADWIERRPSSTLAHATPGGATRVGPAKTDEPTDRLTRITLRALAVDVNGSMLIAVRSAVVRQRRVAPYRSRQQSV